MFYLSIWWNNIIGCLLDSSTWVFNQHQPYVHFTSVLICNFEVTYLCLCIYTQHPVKQPSHCSLNHPSLEIHLVTNDTPLSVTIVWLMFHDMLWRMCLPAQYCKPVNVVWEQCKDQKVAFVQLNGFHCLTSLWLSEEIHIHCTFILSQFCNRKLLSSVWIYLVSSIGW